MNAGSTCSVLTSTSVFSRGITESEWMGGRSWLTINVSRWALSEFRTMTAEDLKHSRRANPCPGFPRETIGSISQALEKGGEIADGLIAEEGIGGGHHGLV